MKDKLNIFWFRRDLRLSDNHVLFEALKSSAKVLPVFIFDVEILSKLENKDDKRVDFILQALQTLTEYLEKSGKSRKILFGKPLEICKDPTEKYEIDSVFCNEAYEPSAFKRELEIAEFLQ